MCILTNRGTECSGKREYHEYEPFPEIEKIDQTKTQTRHPEPNGICDRLLLTLQKIFYNIIFRSKPPKSIEDFKSIHLIGLNTKMRKGVMDT